MDEYLIALALAALPLLSNVGGGLLAEVVPFSQRMLSLALHAAAGVMLSIVGVELMPQALTTETPWIVILAFGAGGGIFVALDEVVHLVGSRLGGADGAPAPWLIYLGVLVDLFSDGVIIGAASTISLSLGMLLALGQVTTDIPEGFATVAAFKRYGLARRARLFVTASFALPVVLGTTISYWAVRGQPEVVKLALLSLAAGILTTVVVEEIVPEAHFGEDARLAALVFIGGFVLFALLATYLQ